MKLISSITIWLF